MRHSALTKILIVEFLLLCFVEIFSSPMILFAAVKPPCLSGYIGINCTPVSSVSPSSSGINTYYLQNYSTSIINIINGIVAPVMLAVAFVFFLYGVYKYFFLGATNESERANGRQFVLWSIIGFVVIFSIWGLVGLVGSTLGLSSGGYAPPYPTL